MEILLKSMEKLIKMEKKLNNMINLSKPIIEDEEKKAVMAVLNSGMIAQGPKVKEFEENFAKYCGTKFAIAVNSGTAAIHCLLYGLQLKPNDEVITVPFTFAASTNPIMMLGAKPVFIDIREYDFNIDPHLLQSKINNKTKAIIAVDLYGQIYDPMVNELANKHNIPVIEDACQAIGAELNHKKAGSFGKGASFSFYATKNMTTAEGGMVTTNDPELAELCKRFRHHGQSEQTRYEYTDIGYNYRMTDIQAAIGIEQLKKIDKLNQLRIKNAQVLSNGLKDISQIKIPKINGKHVFHQYSILCEKRDELKDFLLKNEIGSGVYYPKPLHLHPHFKMEYNEGDFPISEKVSRSVLSLPVHPLLTQDDLIKIINTIKEFYK